MKKNNKKTSSRILQLVALILFFTIYNLAHAQTDSSKVENVKGIIWQSDSTEMGSCWSLPMKHYDGDAKPICLNMTLSTFRKTIDFYTIMSVDYQHMAVKDISSVAATLAGVYVDGSGNISIRGSRYEGAQYIVDGQKIPMYNLVTTRMKSAE